MSERHACRIERQPRATQRRRCEGRTDKAPEAEVRLLELAHTHAGWGCPKLHRQLRHEGHRINHKRTERLYRQHGLSIRRRRRRRRVREERRPLLQPIRPGQCWSINIMGDSLADGRAYLTFNVIDDYARDALAIEIGVSQTVQRVARVLERLCEWHGTPESICSDNGLEFRSDVPQKWANAKGRHGHFIRPDCPAQNAYIERFNGTYRLEVLDASRFRSLDEACTVTEEWPAAYNEQRTHSAIGHLPRAFRRRWQQRQFPEMSGLG